MFRSRRAPCCRGDGKHKERERKPVTVAAVLEETVADEPCSAAVGSVSATSRRNPPPPPSPSFPTTVAAEGSCLSGCHYPKLPSCPCFGSGNDVVTAVSAAAPIPPVL